MPIRTLIVDDEPLARERLSTLLQQWKDIVIVGESGDGKSAVRLIQQEAPDLLLLDIQLPELDGFEILKSLPGERAPAIVFVTAYDRFAVRAFEVHAVDYLLKPVEPERLNQALCRIRNRGKSQQESDPYAPLRQLIHTMQSRMRRSDHILLHSDQEITVLNPSEIDWVESAGNYACFHIGAQTRIVRETMNAVQTQLEKYNFVRIHRAAIVNLDRVRRLKPLLYGDYEIELRDGTKLPMSRTHRHAVIGKLEKS